MLFVFSARFSFSEVNDRSYFVNVFCLSRLICSMNSLTKKKCLGGIVLVVYN